MASVVWSAADCIMAFVVEPISPKTTISPMAISATISAYSIFIPASLLFQSATAHFHYITRCQKVQNCHKWFISVTFGLRLERGMLNPCAMSDCPQSNVDLEARLPIVHVAAVALVDIDGRVLLAQRPRGKSMAGLWEFPGGKLHDGELPEAALIRELKEELGVDVGVGCLMPFCFGSHTYDDFHLFMPLYICRNWDGTVRGLEGQALKWVWPKDLRNYPMPPADLPLVAMLIDYL
jgi:8-oxo-dGTP diphosphatase